MIGIFSLGWSFVSCTVNIIGLVVLISCLSSVSLFLIPFMLIWIILKSLSLVVCGLIVEVSEDEDEDEGDKVDSWVGTASEWREGRPSQTGEKQIVLLADGGKDSVIGLSLIYIFYQTVHLTSLCFSGRLMIVGLRKQSWSNEMKECKDCQNLIKTCDRLGGASITEINL